MPDSVAARNIRLKRAYEAPSAADGQRVLVDRIWPRGVRKDAIDIVLWMKEIAPSTELRKWFGHDPVRWEEFRTRYKAELADHEEDLAKLRAMAADGVLTLVYSAKDEEHNQARVIHEVLVG